jgi:mono/diheme cytochrome c family protein
MGAMDVAVIASRKRMARAVAMLGFLVLACLLPSQLAVGQSAAPAFAPRDESPEEFPAGTGREDAFYACTACHGFRLVAQQGMTRPQWEDSIDWMIKRHNMPPLEGNERKTVLDYLTAAFPPRTRPGGWRNPFVKQ